MRIEDKHLNSTAALPSGRAEQVGAAGRSGEVSRSAPTAGDRVEVSQGAGLVRKAMDEDPQRAARVEQLRAEVQSGSYQVSSQLVSQAMISAGFKL